MTYWTAKQIGDSFLAKLIHLQITEYRLRNIVVDLSRNNHNLNIFQILKVKVEVIPHKITLEASHLVLLCIWFIAMDRSTICATSTYFGAMVLWLWLDRQETLKWGFFGHFSIVSAQKNYLYPNHEFQVYESYNSSIYVFEVRLF